MAANTIATDFNKFIVDYNGKLDGQESRMTRHGGLNLHLADTKMIPTGLGVVGASEADIIKDGGYNPNGVGIAVQNVDNITVSTDGITTCAAGTDVNDTALVDVTYTTISFDMAIPEEQWNYNYVTREQAMSKGLFERTRGVVNRLEDLSILNLEGARNQVQSETMGGFFTDSTDDSYTYSDANKADFYNYAGSLFQKFDTNQDQYRVLANAVHYPAVVNPAFAQGTGNAVNTQYQFTGAPSVQINEFGFPLGNAWDFYNSNRLSNSGSVAGALDTTYISPIGSTGIFSSVDKRFTTAVPDGVPNVVTKFVTSLPGLDPSLQFGVRVTQACTDGKDVYSFQFEGKFAFMAKYNSDPTNNVGLINRFERV